VNCYPRPDLGASFGGGVYVGLQPVWPLGRGLELPKDFAKGIFVILLLILSLFSN